MPGKFSSYSGSSGPKPKKGISPYRQSLLAVVHIGKKELALDDDTYRSIMDHNFDRISAADLTNEQLRQLLDIFRTLGFKRADSDQAEALRGRIRDLAGKIDNGEYRLKKLCFAKCGVNRLDWCHEIGKLKQLLAALGKIEKMEKEGGNKNE